jgi:hypothetical protein
MTESEHLDRLRVLSLVVAFKQADADLCAAARKQFTPETCPLEDAEDNAQHRHMSQALWGCGSWGWTCEFCGEEFQE